MARLFLTGFCVLIISILLAFFSVDRLERRLYRNYNVDFFEYENKGTFFLLEDAIAGRSGTDLQNTVSRIRQRFKYPVDLIPRNELVLPAEGESALAVDGVYLQDNGYASAILFNSAHTDAVWRITTAADLREQRTMAATGVLGLVRDKLVGKSVDSQALVIKELQLLSDIPINLLTEAELDLSDKEIRSLRDQKIVVRNPRDDGEQFWIETDEGGLIFQAGPINYPTSKIQTRTILNTAFFAVLLTGFLFWVWPLWRDLQGLRRASLDMGQGNLDTRVRTRKTSLIRSVLDGFNHMANRTESMVASQRELTNAVSHELRTPLARMMFDLEMAKQTDSSNDRSRHLDSLELSVVELNTLVDELLYYAKQERVESPLELEILSSHDVNRWLREQVNRAKRSQEYNHCINLEVDIADTQTPCFCPKLMSHAFSNGLQNAMRFANSKIEVDLKFQDNKWVLAIEDDGKGIPASERERVFESFSRLDESRKRDSGGFGLGLAIVRKIAEWHQGDAHIVESKTQSGTRLEIRWPDCVDLML